MHRWFLILCALCALAGAVGCASAPPAEVVGALEHQLEDLPLIETELLPLIPEDAELPYETITGEIKQRNARQLWRERVRAFLLRGAALVAWSRGEEFDPEAAFATLFPDRVNR